MRALLERDGLAAAVDVSSAGLGDWHVGEGADPRSLEVLAAHGYDGSTHRARQFDASWFADLDVVVAMDASQVRRLRAMAPPGDEHKVRPLLADQDVPDPYYGGDDGFTQVLRMIEAGCRSLLDELRPTLVR